jgi:diaminopimelate epimerase
MRFTKMHGAGNDYVYVNCFEETVRDPASLARAVSDRHQGVGSDGLVLILPERGADARMRMFNSDGSEAEMCGNAIRCVAKYLYDHGLARREDLRIMTGAGLLSLVLYPGRDGRIERVRVDMGEPRLAPDAIPTKLPGRDGKVIDAPLSVAGQTFDVTCVSMGNPHAVIYVDDVAAFDLERLGPQIERHPLFPAKINVHVVEVASPREVTMRTWERGAGITMACGTGASAVCVAGVLTGQSDREILAHLPGGDLELQWLAETNHVFMTGPAAEVFTGEWPEA